MIELLTRDGCRLCEPVEAVVKRWTRRLGLGLRVVDVDLDLNLIAEYGDRVPVVRDWAGTVLAEGNANRRRLVWKLIVRRMRRRRRRGQEP